MEEETKKELPKCHVCGKDKHSYEVYFKSDIFSIMQFSKTHEEARKGGEICQRCDSYYAMTRILKEPTEQEFNEAKL